MGDQDKLVVTSKFGRRPDPVTGTELTPHNGIDIRTGGNISLSAPIDGKLERIDESAGDGFGNYVRINATVDGVDIVVYLAHLSNISVAHNTNVTKGQPIGTTGSSGKSTGPHLHVGVKINTVWVDPMPFLFDHWVEDTSGRPLHYVLDDDHPNYHYESFEREVNGFRLMPAANRAEPTLTANTIPSESETAPQNPKPVNNKTIAEERLAPGIWQIIKLVIDYRIADKQVLDSGISTMQGSLINYFGKVCQEPFVELFGDTYGDQYCFIARRPPFDRDGLRAFSRMQPVSDADDVYANEQGEYAGRAWVIEDGIVIGQNIGFDSNTAYSWYYYLPKMDTVDGGEKARMFIPAVFFPEYASIWGSKPLSVSSNYFHFVKSGVDDITEDRTKLQNNDFIIRKAWDDLKYLVESNAYMPFTRSGTLTLQGFRGVKRGVWIRYKGWRYFVDQVTHDYNVTTQGATYTTTLVLSRGLKEPFIDGVTVRGTLMSYFNLIDFGDAESKDITTSNWKENLAKWKVNIRVFNYFMSREYLLHPHRDGTTSTYLEDGPNRGNNNG